MAAPHLSPLERKVLEIVVEHKEVESRGICESLGRRQIVISTVLKKLFDQGLLHRKVDKTKRRGFIYGTEPFPED